MLSWRAGWLCCAPSKPEFGGNHQCSGLFNLRVLRLVRLHHHVNYCWLQLILNVDLKHCVNLEYSVNRRIEKQRTNGGHSPFSSVGCGRLSNFTSTAHLSPDYGLDRAPREFTASLPTLRTNLFVCLCKLSDMSSYLWIFC